MWLCGYAADAAMRLIRLMRVIRLMRRDACRVMPRARTDATRASSIAARSRTP